MKRILPLLHVALVGYWVGISPPASAQNPAMSLMGSVQSNENQPLPGAAITVIHLPSGVRHAAASDATGRFVIPNLMVGGPYIIQVGEGGYRPQTVENIFLKSGKTANFTVTLDKLGAGKTRTSSPAPFGSPMLALASEATVGGPVLVTTISAPAKAVGPAAAPGRPAAAPTPPPAPTRAGAPQPPPEAAPVALALDAPAKPGTAPAMGAALAAPSPYHRRYLARPSDARIADPIVPGHFDARTGNYFYETGPATSLALANGSTIANVGTNSTESYLYRFLSSPQMQVDTVDLTRGWYNFDRVFFEPGKATLTPASLSQLRNISALLRAYPNARIKLGGYTDDTGAYKVNRELSDARARTAWASLVEMGISATRIEARGYGTNYSIASNATEEGRAKNRRLGLKVLQK